MKQNARLKNWVSPKEDALPDFIIGGAMKSGTTTLHHVLERHPKIFIPKGEIHFFDIDNLMQHSDFNFYDKKKDEWIVQSMQSDPDRLWKWYLDRFTGNESMVKGEDSTTYLASQVAAERIAMQKKDIKMIFLLRQPTSRAYSQYYHLLRSGHATHSFEDTIRFNPNSILERSLYKEQLEAYYKVLPAERIKVYLFEELIKDMKGVVTDICEFIGVDVNEFDSDVFEMHSNKSRLPKNLDLQLKRNNLLRSFGNAHYRNTLPVQIPKSAVSISLPMEVTKRLHGKINPLVVKSNPKISPATKAFLDQYYYHELEGIDELVNKDILSKWFK